MFCPCGSQKPYEACCAPYLSGKEEAPTPEALMRSRYTAYTMGDLDYIERTMKEKALMRFNKTAAKTSLEGTTWLHLTVIASTEEGDRGTVQFMATFKHHGQDGVLHEVSQFKRIDGKWYYTDGEVS